MSNSYKTNEPNRYKTNNQKHTRFGVVGPEVPGERVEVGELPGEQNPSQHKCTRLQTS